MNRNISKICVVSLGRIKINETEVPNSDNTFIFTISVMKMMSSLVLVLGTVCKCPVYAYADKLIYVLTYSHLFVHA